MLTASQVIALCQEEGIVVKLKRTALDNKVQGDYVQADHEVILYLPNITSQSDFDLTLLHEFIHARDDYKYWRTSERQSKIEKEVENEALKTYNCNPSVLELIKELYGIKKFIWLTIE